MSVSALTATLFLLYNRKGDLTIMLFLLYNRVTVQYEGAGSSCHVMHCFEAETIFWREKGGEQKIKGLYEKKYNIFKKSIAK